MNHALVKLARAIDWRFLEERFGAVYGDKPGQPPLPTRLMAGLAILKHSYDLSDDALSEVMAPRRVSGRVFNRPERSENCWTRVACDSCGSVPTHRNQTIPDALEGNTGKLRSYALCRYS
jgi:hypothetical protein